MRERFAVAFLAYEACPYYKRNCSNAHQLTSVRTRHSATNAQNKRRSIMLKKLAAAILTVCAAIAFANSTVAADNMTPEEAHLRAKITNYMRAAASVEWIPTQDVPYWNPEHNFSFKKGETYYGLPYTQFSRNNNLTSFRACLEERDGKNYYVGPSDFNNYCGSDCSASVSNAWKQADPNFPSLLTRRMIPDRPKEVVPVGKYKLNFYDSTPNIVKENGFDVMKAAYAQLKPGDAVVMHYDYDGHVMLILKNEPENNRVFISDQTGLSKGVPKGRDGHSTFRIDCEYSYEQLFNSSYIPIALRKVDDAAHEIPLFNRVDLSNWDVCVAGEPLGEDATGVFSVQDGLLRVSGEKWGGLATKESYSNYRLTVEFKWGKGTFGPRAKKARDSGVLIHGFGDQGSVGGVWLKAVEANILEGGVGDFWIVGNEEDGISGTCDVIERNGKRVFSPKDGKPVTIKANAEGAFQWYGHDENWQDVTGFRGPRDRDKPGEWTELVVYAVDDEMQVYVNGKFVNRVYGLKRTSGKIQLQSEGAEIFFRRVSIRPWDEKLD